MAAVGAYTPLPRFWLNRRHRRRAALILAQPDFETFRQPCHVIKLDDPEMVEELRVSLYGQGQI